MERDGHCVTGRAPLKLTQNNAHSPQPSGGKEKPAPSMRRCVPTIGPSTNAFARVIGETCEPALLLEVDVGSCQESGQDAFELRPLDAAARMKPM